MKHNKGRAVQQLLLTEDEGDILLIGLIEFGRLCGWRPHDACTAWAPDIYGNVSEQELMWAKVRLYLCL